MINKREIVFVRILIPFALGISIGWNYASSLLLYCSVFALLLELISLLLLNLLYVSLRVYYRRETIGLLFSLFWLTLGVCGCLVQNEQLKNNHFSKGRTRCFKIRIADEPLLKNNITRFKAEVIVAYDKVKGRLEGKQVCGKLMVALKQGKSVRQDLNYGDELLIRAEIKEVDTPENPGEFDYKFWLSTQNVYHQVFLGVDDVMRLNRNSGNLLWTFAIQLRSKQVAIFNRMLPDRENFALASTLVLGYKSDLSKEVLAIYSKTGTIHALSVSGMHVGIVYLILNWALQFMDRKRIMTVVKVIIIFCAVWFYALLTGFSPSILRAAIMISVFIAAGAAVRHINSYNILAFAAFCLLAYNPFLLWDVGFQLSFLAVLGLIALQPKIERCWPMSNKFLAKLWSAVAVSVSAQIITFPLVIYYFHQFPVYFLLSNLFILIPVALLMYLGIALLLLRLTVLAPVVNWLINFTNSGLDCISSLPGATVSGIWISKTELFLLSGTIALLILILYFRRKELLFSLVFFFLIFQCSCSMRHLAALKQERMVCFKIRKQTIRALVYGETAILFIHQKPSARDFDYFLKPGLEKYGIRQLSWRTILSDDQ